MTEEISTDNQNTDDPSRLPRKWAVAGLLVALALFISVWAQGLKWGLPSAERNALYFRDDPAEAELPDAPVGEELWLQYPNFLPGVERTGGEPRSAFNPIRSLHPDEYVVLKGLLAMTPSKLDFYPGFFAWPPLYFWQVGGGLAVAWGAGYIDLEPEHRNIESAFRNPENFSRAYIVGRMVTFIFALIAIAAAWATAYKLYCSEAAVATALFLAVAPGFTYHADFMTADIPMLAWIMLCALFSVMAMRNGKMRWYLLAGACVGIAAATRYQGAFAALAVIAAHLLSERESGRPIRARLFDRRLWLAGAVAIGLFLAFNPYVITRPGFIAELSKELDGSRWPTAGRWEALSASLRTGLGLPLALISSVGFFFIVIRNIFVTRYREDIFLCVTFLPVSIWLFWGTPAMVRYWFAALPFAIFAAGLIGAELVIAKPTHKSRGLLAAGIAVISLVTLGAWMNSMAHAMLRRGTDVRLEAGQYIADKIPEGATIGVIEDPWQFRMPPIDMNYYEVIVTGMNPEALQNDPPYWFIFTDYHLPPLAVRGELNERERAFMRLLMRSGLYEAAIFHRVPTFAGLRFGSPDAPHDMRYLNPRIYILRQLNDAQEE